MSKYPRNGNVRKLVFRPMIPGQGPADEDLLFDCFLTSAISDDNSPQWSEHFDMGRADPKVMYTGHSRSLGFSFMTIATNKDEHDANYTKLRKLALLTYPLRRPNQGYNAPFVYYEIAELLEGIGYITSLSLNWELEYPWDGDAKRPVYTQVTISIRNLTDGLGNRPDYKIGAKKHGTYKYFHRQQPDSNKT